MWLRRRQRQLDLLFALLFIMVMIGCDSGHASRRCGVGADNIWPASAAPATAPVAIRWRLDMLLLLPLHDGLEAGWRSEAKMVYH